MTEVCGAKLIDISVPISSSTVSWRDAFHVRSTWHSHISAGDQTTNSSWYLHAHTGTHVDAPLHHLRGTAVDGLDLADFLGPCRVIDFGDVPGSIPAERLREASVRRGDRLLLRTGNSARGLMSAESFTETYTGLSPEAAEYLVEVGVRMVGIDYLSVEPRESRSADTHRTLLGAGIGVLEGIRLEDVSAGEYLLLFLPLKLAGAEAAPGRAVLVDGKPEVLFGRDTVEGA